MHNWFMDDFNKIIVSKDVSHALKLKFATTPLTIPASELPSLFWKKSEFNEIKTTSFPFLNAKNKTN